MLSFKTQLPFDSIDEWRPVRALPCQWQLQALSDPAIRQRLVEAASRGNYAARRGGEAEAPKYDSMKIYSSPLPPHRSVGEVARERGYEPVELMIDLALDTELGQFFFQPVSDQDDSEILPALTHPRCVMTSPMPARIRARSPTPRSRPTCAPTGSGRSRRCHSSKAVRMVSWEPARRRPCRLRPGEDPAGASPIGQRRPGRRETTPAEVGRDACQHRLRRSRPPRRGTNRQPPRQLIRGPLAR